MDAIELKEIACKVRLRVRHAQRVKRRDLFIDLRLETDLAACGKRDDLRAAVDYWSVEKLVREAAQAQRWWLVESIAARAAQVTLARYKQVDVARVRAVQRPASRASGRFIAVELTRAQNTRAASLDRVWVHAIECRVKIGVPEQERRRPQKILFDVGLETDFSRCTARDDFRLALDTESVADIVQKSAESRSWRLLEAVAERVAATLLHRQKRALAVIVRARKRPAVMSKTECVVVEIERRRNHVSL